MGTPWGFEFLRQFPDSGAGGAGGTILSNAFLASRPLVQSLSRLSHHFCKVGMGSLLSWPVMNPVLPGGPINISVLGLAPMGQGVLLCSNGGPLCFNGEFLNILSSYAWSGPHCPPESP